MEKDKDEEIYIYTLGGNRGACLGLVLKDLLAVGAKVIRLGSDKDMEDGNFTRNQEDD
jgi:hypothetical protein